MNYLSASQIEVLLDDMVLEVQLGVYKKALTHKDIDSSLSKVDCLAMSMGYVKCISGSGFYEPK